MFDGVDVVDVAGSGFAEHAEAVVADGLEVGAAGDEGDVVAGLEEAGADEAADSAGAHYQYAHGALISEGRLGANSDLCAGKILIPSLSHRRFVRNSRVVARKTPHPTLSPRRGIKSGALLKRLPPTPTLFCAGAISNGRPLNLTAPPGED